jgi:hypothetical protein
VLSKAEFKKISEHLKNNKPNITNILRFLSENYVNNNPAQDVFTNTRDKNCVSQCKPKTGNTNTMSSDFEKKNMVKVMTKEQAARTDKPIIRQ